MEVELAVSSVVGSGLFVCCVSLAAVILVAPVEIHDRVAFVSLTKHSLTAFALSPTVVSLPTDLFSALTRPKKMQSQRSTHCIVVQPSSVVMRAQLASNGIEAYTSPRRFGTWRRTSWRAR